MLGHSFSAYGAWSESAQFTLTIFCFRGRSILSAFCDFAADPSFPTLKFSEKLYQATWKLLSKENTVGLQKPD